MIDSHATVDHTNNEPKAIQKFIPLIRPKSELGIKRSSDMIFKYIAEKNNQRPSYQALLTFQIHNRRYFKNE